MSDDMLGLFNAVMFVIGFVIGGLGTPIIAERLESRWRVSPFDRRGALKCFWAALGLTILAASPFIIGFPLLVHALA